MKGQLKLTFFIAYYLWTQASKHKKTAVNQRFL